MIEIGKYNTLRILRQTSVGLFLGDESEESVLLPNKYCKPEFKIDEQIEVFVYLDHEERKIATTLEPGITLHQFAFLQVRAVTNVGAFLDWGLEKELLVPFSEQRQNMEPNRWYIVYLDIDKKTNRLFASNKIDKYLQNSVLTVSDGDEADLLIYRKTDLGYQVIINQQHLGMVFSNEIFEEIHIGDELRGWIKNIRPDKKIDVSLQPLSFEDYNDRNAAIIYAALLDEDGFIPLTDKSTPEEISDWFGISKKAFKKSIGSLYKQKRIRLDEDGIRWIKGD